jgi:hypothetical protein
MPGTSNAYRFYNPEQPSDVADNHMRNIPKQPPPHSVFPKISDFLKGLDKQFDDPPHSFSKFIDVLTNDSQLDFGRINEIIMVANDANIPGGQWVKTQIETAHEITGSFYQDNVPFAPIRISLGMANLMFQQMKATINQIEMEWQYKSQL